MPRRERMRRNNTLTISLEDLKIGTTHTSYVSLVMSVVDISLQLCAKAPTLDQRDLEVDFMVQGKAFNLDLQTTNKQTIFFRFFFK